MLTGPVTLIDHYKLISWPHQNPFSSEISQNSENGCGNIILQNLNYLSDSTKLAVENKI